jgi:adenine phosphoribosyltransferase
MIQQDPESLRAYLRDVPDFPTPGILFRDISPLLAEPAAFRSALDVMAERARPLGATKIIGIESRGFLFGAPLADRLQVGFVPVRKPGKLPTQVHSVVYGLEYGSDTLELQTDALRPADLVLIVDDVLATGGTADAAAALVSAAGAGVLGWLFLVELVALSGRGRLLQTCPTAMVDSLLTY